MNEIVSVGANIRNTNFKKEVELYRVFDFMEKDLMLEAKIHTIRKTKDSDKKDTLKANLPYFVSGTFKSRKNKELKKAHLLIYDFDHCIDKDLESFDFTVCNQILAAFVSPSGDGLKIICKLSEPVTSHVVFSQIYKHYQPQIDELVSEIIGKEVHSDNTSDVARACYFSSGKVYRNEDAVPLDTDIPEEEPEKVEVKKQDTKSSVANQEINKNLAMAYFNKAVESELNKLAMASKGIRNRTLNEAAFALASLSSGYRNIGVHVDEAGVKSNLRGIASNIGLQDKEIKKTLNSGWKAGYAEPRRDLPEFKYVKQESPTAGGATEKKSKKAVKAISQDLTTVNSIFGELPMLEKTDNSTGEVDEIVKFWEYDTDKNKLRIPKRQFMDFLSHFGFGKYWLNENKSFLVRVINNIVYNATPIHLKDFVCGYVEVLDDPVETIKIQKKKKEHVVEITRAMIIECLLNTPNLFVDYNLTFLKPVDVKFVRGNEYRDYIFFQNRYLIIDKDNIQVKPYSKLPFKVWDSQRIDMDFDEKLFNQDSHAEFEHFINFITGDDSRVRALETSIGYLLHTYKDEATTKAVFLVDEILSETPEGGTGKSLIGKAISKVRNVTRIDGQNFNFDSQFRFQDISIDTEIVEFNDCPKNFNFQRLFGVITDDMQIEKKHSNSFTINFKDSPKFFGSTNYTIQGEGTSFERRLHEVELADHYGLDLTPRDDFGHLFFSGWDKAEWMLFYSYMADCLQSYMKNGLTAYDEVNISERKLRDTTSPEFVQYVDDQVSIGNLSDYQLKKNFYDNLRSETGLKNGIRSVTRWMKIYAKYRGFIYKDIKKRHTDAYGNVSQPRWFKLEKIEDVKYEPESNTV